VERSSDRIRGLSLSFAGVLVLSPDALIIRLIDEDPWTIVCWLKLFGGISLTVMAYVVSRGHLVRAFRAIGRIGLLIAVFQAVAGVSFVLAVTQTSVANVLVIVAAAPLFTAVMTRLFLHEAVPPRTWVAVVCVVVGVGIVFSGSLSTGGILGDVFAICSALGQAAASTAVRRARAVNVLPALAIAASLSFLLAVAMGAVIPDRSNIGLMAFHGLVLAPGALALLTTAVRYLPAPEVSLINQLELVLGPVWVWAVLSEAPSLAAVVGGIIVGTTLVAHTLKGLRASQVTVAPA
jgi:drug/metabolite transporter (DMT)-like permease